MRVQLAEQAQEILGQSDVVIITERVDDVALLIGQMARMGLPEVSLGVIPGYGGTQRLARLVGKGKAMEMILSAGMIDANDALQWGLVNRVVPQDQLLSTAHELAIRIMKNSPTALAAAIRAVNAGYEPGADGMQREIEEFGKCFGTADFKEGTSAFMEKRKANVTGE